MKKLILGIAILAMLGLSLGGCFSSNSDYYPSENTPANNVPDTPDLPVDNPPAIVLDNPPPENVTWISPGKVMVGNFYPGATAEYPLTIHNGNDATTGFIVSYRYPDTTATGYEKPSPAVQDWVIIADTTPVLAPFETREIMVVLTMPEDAVVFAEHWEFWVSVSDASQTGIVSTAMATRWLIDMRSG